MKRGYKYIDRKQHQSRRMLYDRESARVKKLEQELREQKQANQEVMHFFFGLSHDIRTPMNAMIGLADIALEHSDNQEKVEECLAKMKSSGIYLLDLVNEIMDLAKINEGERIVHEESFCLTSFMEQLLSLYRPQFLVNGQELLYCEKDIVNKNLIGDKVKLSRLFGNLLGNANKFTLTGGYEKVSVREVGADREGYAKFEFLFEDNGYGMSKDFQKHLFQPFAREQKRQVGEIEGTGFGMAVVKRIVDLLEGTIEVESKPNYGTTFCIGLQFQIDTGDENAHPMKEFSLEQYKEAGQESQKDEAAAAVESGAKGCVLLADDNFINQEIAKEQLEKLGYKVELATNGGEVFEKLESAKKQPYDLILLDLHMPVMSGCEIAEKIRKLDMPWCRQIPIFAVTASSPKEELAQTVKSGMNGYLQKPISITQLEHVLKLCDGQNQNLMTFS